VVLHGTSAVGKSSLLNAGVLPLLDETRAEVLPVVRLPIISMRQFDGPIDRNPTSYLALRAWMETDEASLSPASLSDFLADRAIKNGTSRKPHRVLAAIDQFDRIFDVPEYERESFIGELAEALRNVPELNLLLVVGDGSMDQFNLYQEQLWKLDIAHFELGTLTYPYALEAVSLPLTNAGHSFQPDAANELIVRLGAAAKDNESPGEMEAVHVEPLLLQLACLELWSRIPSGMRVITADLLHELDDIDQALQYFYETTLHEAHLITGKPQNALRGWIENAFISKNGESQSARLTTGLVAGMPNKVVALLVERYFLAVERRSRGTSYRLTFPTLVKAVIEVNRMWRSAAGEHALDYEPEAIGPEVFAVAARDAFAEGNLNEAQNLALLAAESYSRSGNERQLAHALMLRGDIACARGDLDIADESFKAALSRFSVLEDRNLTAKTLSALGEIRAMEGDYRRAEQFQRLAIDHLPTDVNALVSLGYAQWYGGSPANAEATFSQALAWDANATLAMSGRGQVRAELQEYESALIDLDQALSAGLAPGDEDDARSARALALAGLGRAADAERELMTIRGHVPRARTLLRSARVALMAGRTDTAAAELERAFAARPPLSPAEDAVARRMRKRLKLSNDASSIC
jgi:tetratricopeptide (TPR) repeat protein